MLPNDYAVGLTPKQVMLLVKINMQHLPVPPQPGVFPGVMSKSTSEEKDSLKKLIAALDRMAKFTQVRKTKSSNHNTLDHTLRPVSTIGKD